jgi:ABC-2 type transport system ATP-binding protein
MQAVNALECSHVSHSYSGRLALDDVSFSIPPGNFAVLLGRNGAGKTTLISLITRLYHARQGSMRVFGADLREEALRALAVMGVVFQQLTIDLDLSIRENLLYHGALYGLSRRERKLRACEELDRIGLSDRIDDKVRNLSGGMRRRVEIARALLHQPRLLLLDEPTAGLDMAVRSDILTHVQSLCRQRGTAVLWTTHLIEEVEAADLAIVMHHGRVVQCGAPGEILGEARGRSGTETFLELTAEAN